MTPAFEDNLKQIKESIASACAKSGRSPDAVTLIAVTKTYPGDAVLRAVACGLGDIGESRIQEAQEKFAFLADSLSGVRKHLIGHLQTNKVKKAVELFDVIQSLDSLRLAAEIDRQAERRAKIQDCLVEIKVSAEETKCGIVPDDAETFVAQLSAYRHLRVRGLMTMAPYAEDVETVRALFALTKNIFDRIAATRATKEFSILSMGMSNDYSVAIEEGSTMVRIGTALFGKR